MKTWRKRLIGLLLLVMSGVFLSVGNGIVVCAEETEGEEEILPVVINADSFPDENLRDYVSEEFDVDQDGILSVVEIKSVKQINLYRGDVANLKGIEIFKNLTRFYCRDLSIESLNLGKNKKLKTISCWNCSLKKLDISENKELQQLECMYNDLEQLDVSNNEKLQILYCQENKLKSLDLSSNNVLKNVECYKNQLEVITFGDENLIQELLCSDNKLEKLETEKLRNLRKLYCSNNELKKIDTSNNLQLEKFDFSNHKNIEFDISKNDRLEGLSCEGCAIESLDLKNNKKLKGLNCSNNSIKELDLTDIEKLTSLYCNNNKLVELDVYYCDRMVTLDCSNNEIAGYSLQLPDDITKLNCSHNKLEVLDLKYNSKLYELDCSYNKLKSIGIWQAVYPLEKLSKLNCSNNLLTYLNISSLTGLRELDCSNNQLTYLVSTKKLYDLKCDNNKLERLTLEEGIGCVDCSNNALTSLDLQVSPRLSVLDCSHNKLSNLDLQNNMNLRQLYCDDNKLIALNLENNRYLYDLQCSNNHLTFLNLEKNIYLEKFQCKNNEYAVSQESQLDLSTLSGFKLEKASLWKNAAIVKPILFVLDSELPVTYTYNVGQNLKADFRISFDKVPSKIYNFEYLYGSYSRTLAEDSARYSMLAYDEHRLTEDGQFYVQDKGRQNYPSLLLGQLKKDGFYNCSHYNYRDNNPHNCSYTFATRNVRYKGWPKTQILICIRGTDSVEWEGNMELTGTDYNTNYTDTHYSFEKASNDVEASLYHYIETIKKKGVDTNQCVIWVTGHSRGGAVANLLAAKLTDSGNNSIGDVFGYTYATVNTTMKYKNKSYRNIFNHCFADDFVPNVPFEKWGYGNYGITYVVNADYAYQAGQKATGGVYRQFKDGMDKFVGFNKLRSEIIGADFNYKETDKMLRHVTNYWKDIREYYDERTIWGDNEELDVSLYTFFCNGIAKLAQGKMSYLLNSSLYTNMYHPLGKVFFFFVKGNSFKHNINDTHQSYTYYLATKLGLFNSSNSASLAANNTVWEIPKTGQPQDIVEQRAIENSDSLSGNSMDYYPASVNSVSQNTISENHVPENENIYGESIPNERAGISEEEEKTILTCEEERERLVQFSTLDENKSKLGWNLSDNSTWSGIEFDEEGYVISIDISYKELTGVLDVSGFSKLKLINCEGNELTSLILNDCISLVQAECYYNALQTLQIKNCENLQYLDCDGNELEELDLSTCMNVTELICSNNQLTYLDVSLQSQLDVLFCQENRLTNIVLPETNSLSRLNCEYNYLKDLSQFEALAQNTAVWVLYREQKVPEDAVYAASDLENLKRLANTDENLKKLGWNLEAPDTWDGITWRYVSGTYYVEDIQLANRNLTGNLQLSNMEQVQSITLAENSISGLEINQCAKLECVNCMENEIEKLSLTDCNSLWKILAYYNCLKNENVEKILQDFGTKENSVIELHSQYIKGTKEEFSSKEMKIILNLVNGKENEGQFQISEEEPGRWDYVKWEKQADNLYHITEIDFSGLWLGGTLDLTGFTALKYIDCDNTNLEEVILPDSLEAITAQAFLDCKLLKKVTIPASVKTIEEYAFARCSNLTEVLFYSKNAEIDSNSFYKSTSIRSISCYKDTTEANFAYESQPTFSYWDKKGENDKENNNEPSKQPVTDKPLPGNKTNIPALKKGDIRIKGSGKYKITKVGKGYGTVIYLKCTNKKIKSVTIPSTITIDKQKFKVTEIGEKAFYGCKNLKKVTIGKHIVKIRQSAFAKCPKLKTIKIQSLSLKSVGKNAFKGISKNATISVPKAKQKKYITILRKKAVGLNKNAKIKAVGKKK